MPKKEVAENGTQKTPEKKDRPSTKPQYSYISLVTMAILDSPERKRTLGDIIEYIRAKFPYYGQNCPVKGWRNSIRHNLSLNDCFIKTQRDPARPSRGHFWTLHPRCSDMFEGGSFMRRKKRFSAPESRLKKSQQSASGKPDTTNSHAWGNALPRRRRNEAPLESVRDVEERTSDLQSPYGWPDATGPSQTHRLSRWADYPGPAVMSRSFLRSPGWSSFGGDFSVRLGQPQYLLWAPPLQRRAPTNELARSGYEYQQCSGCTCGY